MGKERQYLNQNIDLKAVAKDVYEFFIEDGFPDVKVDEDPNGNWYEIQATKKGALRTLTSSRKAIHIILKGDPNKCTITQTTGDWGKNIAVSAFLTGSIGLIGLGFDVRFSKKLWKFLQNSVEQHSNNLAIESSKRPSKAIDDSSDEILNVLKMKFVKGEITSSEYEERKKILDET